MSARTKAALLSALASTGPAGAKAAQKIKYLDTSINAVFLS